jgi:hypothetical protein
MEYRSPFRCWDARAWVRSKPHQPVDFLPGRAFFTPEVVPLLAHPDASRLDRDAVDELCARHLQWHLAMTVDLELGPVNDAVHVIRDAGDVFPRELRSDALRLYTDEAGHAEMCATLADAVERSTGIRAPDGPPPFVRAVRAAVASAPDDVRDAVRLLAAFVSETLISATLTRVPFDDRVQTGVRQLVADHAEDERRHAVLFRDVFARWWPALDADVHRALAALAPELVHAFLAPDLSELEAAASAHQDVFGDPAVAAAEAAFLATTDCSFHDAAEPVLRVFGRLPVEERRRQLA